jgi:hypothetical protein
MSTILKNSKILKDLECKKGQLSSRPPISYVPPTDLLATKDLSKNLKIKLPNGTVFTMTIFLRWNTEEYLAHVIAVLQLINQKGVNVLCRKLAKLLEKQAVTLADLHKSIGPKGSNYKEDQEAFRVEIKQTQELHEATEKEHDKAVAKICKLPRNLLSGNPQTQCNQVCCKMHKPDSWAGVNGEKTIGRHLRL